MQKKTASDLAWEKYGETDPYFGVCTEDIYKTANLTEDSLKVFFDSGKSHVDHVVDVFSNILKTETKFNSILDFGCGTGRLVIPFASAASEVTGIDVSKSMLEEAKKHINALGLNNIELLNSNSLDILQGKKYDLVHTFIVLQHIPVSAGYRLIYLLLEAINSGGCGMIHFTYSNEKTAYKNLKYNLRSKYRFFAQVNNLAKGKKPNAANMQMNNYSINSVLKMIRESGVENFYTELTDHGGFKGLCIYLQKP